MKLKVQEKQQVIALRKQGLSYSEILKKVHVSKSSISFWLKDSPLSEREKRLLKHRKNKNITLGRIRAGASLRAAREKRDFIIFEEAKNEFEKFFPDHLFQVGLALYWAEGSKRNSSFGFANSDPYMVTIMLDWMVAYFQISRKEIYARLYTHKPFAHERAEEFWSRKIGISLSNFKKTVYKTSGSLVKKRPDYKGCIRIEFYRVSYFKKLKIWLSMFIERYEKQR